MTSVIPCRNRQKFTVLFSGWYLSQSQASIAMARDARPHTQAGEGCDR
jgi:hypothetical protein